jgi:RNA polymerase sigma factor (sigma-70 family)
MAEGSRRLSPDQVETVLAAASTGAAWAFDALYRDFAPSVVAYLRVQGASDPEDLSSEVFLAVFKGLSAFHGGDGEFRTWLFSIAHHRVVDDRRRRSRRVAEVGPDDAAAEPASATGTDGAALAALEAERIERLCRQLSADQRDVLLLRLVADLSLEATAQALGKSVGAVKALQHRGLQALKKVLVQEIVGGAVSR